jgi:hypothetical protein
VNGIRGGVGALESLQTKERSSGREPAISITAGSMIAHTTKVTISTVIDYSELSTAESEYQGPDRKDSQVTSSPIRICITDVLAQLATAALANAVSLEIGPKGSGEKLTKTRAL